MSEKVILTQEQDRVIKKALKNRNGDRAQLLEDHAKMRGCWIAEYEVMDDLTISDMARVIYDGGFEVEKPNFQKGDVIVRKDGRTFANFNFAEKIEGFFNGFIVISNGTKWTADFVRHATPEEVFWLYELKRYHVNDFREGDVIITQEVSYRYSTDGGVDTIGPHTTQLWLDEGIIKGIYPAESFKPFKKEQTNEPK